MVSSCLMLGCTSSTSTKGLSFHRFPKDPKLKSLWVAATRRHKWEPTKLSRICGAYFSPNGYKNKKLLACTVPKRGIEAGSVPKQGIEVTHKASPLQGDGIQVQGVQFMDRQENYVEKASHYHLQPLLILTLKSNIMSFVLNRSLLTNMLPSLLIVCFVFGFPVIDAL